MDPLETVDKMTGCSGRALAAAISSNQLKRKKFNAQRPGFSAFATEEECRKMSAGQRLQVIPHEARLFLVPLQINLVLSAFVTYAVAIERRSLFG